jgi:capsular polysaccharide export protein
LTSLAGFEALLRGKQVVCHGLPFYAGWGLTCDRLKVARRNRERSLDELVAAALISYPRYVSKRTGRLCSVEEAVADLIRLRTTDGSRPRWWQRALRPILYKP